MNDQKESIHIFVIPSLLIGTLCGAAASLATMLDAGSMSRLVIELISRIGIALALVLALFAAWETRQMKRRLSKELCPSCGYDLRATPDRCPECGHISAKGGNFDQSADNMNTKDR